MDGFLLLIPLLLIRYGLLSLLNKEAMQRAAFFPPVSGKEKAASLLYQLSTVLLFVYLCFLRVKTSSAWLDVGLAVYGLGTVLFCVATVNFASPSESGVNRSGLYRLSRNPMYVAYFVYFLGCVLLTQSIPLFFLLIVFQVSSHWIILSEERWCQDKFGDEYVRYMQSVRRYL